MASSPHATTRQFIHGDWDALLFSTRPAWIWDGDNHCFVWANPAARRRFGNDIVQLQKNMPFSAATRLSKVSKFKRVRKTRETVSFGKEPACGLLCELESLRLADGRAGLIIKAHVDGYAAAQDEMRLQSAGEKKPPNRAKTKKINASAVHAGKPEIVHSNIISPAPQLSEDELRAFRSLGRRIKKLCRQRADALRNSAASIDASAPQTAPFRSARPAETGLAAAQLHEAFDAFIVFSGDETITRLSGRLQRTGFWSARTYCGAAVTMLAHPRDRDRLHNLLMKVRNGHPCVVTDELLLVSRKACVLPCRLHAGRLQQSGAHEGASYWLAVTRLTMKPRLARLMEKQTAATPAIKKAA